MTGPEWIPMRVVISGATWNQLRGDLEEVLALHPVLFPEFEKGLRDYENWDPGPAYRAGEDFKDAWECVWRSAVDGIEGVVVEHPLRDWERLDEYVPPDPLVQWDRGPAEWEGEEQRLKKDAREEKFLEGYLPHGFLFNRLQYLRGFENSMLDYALEDERLAKLIRMLVDHNRALVDRWLSYNVDVVHFADDLGTQTASVISPAHFHRWITPAYRALMQSCRQAGCHVYLHSDGYIMELMDEFLEAGVTIINPQDLCNGIDNLAREVKGRMCIDLDIDRQRIVPFGTAKEIWELIEEEVRKLGSREGGLEMVAGIYPPTPPENVHALCKAMEAFRTYWW
jgi:hypothetical protein